MIPLYSIPLARKVAVALFAGCLLTTTRMRAQEGIDRQALVGRNSVEVKKADPLSSLSVGNGHFCFTVDVTGLQSFPDWYAKGVPLGTESDWGWHSFPDTAHFAFAETLKDYTIHGRKVSYSVQVKTPEHNRRAADWYRQNVHRLQLGNLGFELTKKDGTLATVADLHDIHQVLNLWKGEITSSFTLDSIPVYVSTMVHPKQDEVAVSVRSSLIGQGRLKVRLRLPYPTGNWDDAGNNWTSDDRHESKLVGNNEAGAIISHRLDSTRYFIGLEYSPSFCEEKSPHYFLVTPHTKEVFTLTCRFTRNYPLQHAPDYMLTQIANTTFWSYFWLTGGAVDFSGSTDPRAAELERRIILSQYLTRIQSAGDYPPQETGLTYNSWYGKPHLEMHWWHDAHFALWGHPDLLERSLDWYKTVVTEARKLAQRQGYKGIRWQKMTDPEGKESPSSVGAFLIWQQPHFIYMAELIYRAHVADSGKASGATAESVARPGGEVRPGGGRAILEKYKDLVFATADFMADYAWYDKQRHRYVLGNGVIPAQERFAEDSTVNPIFELAYWRWALGMAQEWRRRLGLVPEPTWQKVLDGLSELPQQNGLYSPVELPADAYTNPRYRTDHPIVLGTLGFLPVTKGLDTALMHRTFDWVWSNWEWKDTWGWDFPLTAMSATRLGLRELAVGALLMPVQKNTYLPNGHNYQDERLRLYLPGNGGLLMAVALMCAGYDGAAGDNPGFPRDGRWKVRWEGLKKMP